jgi:S1-C subfamily serine protease
MNLGTRSALLAAFLGGGIVAGLGLARSFDRRTEASESAAIPRPVPPAELVGLQESFAKVAEYASPFVVHITTQASGGGDIFQPMGVGSGVIVSEKGHIVTNNHVVDPGAERARALRVRFADGKEYAAKVVGADSESDLAILKIDFPAGEKRSAITFADSDQVRVGDWCLAIGSPFGYNHSVTAGIVSAKHRRAQLAQPYQDFIQTDAAINPGNSGGALVNIKGDLIGINTAIITESRGSDGVGLAISSNIVKWVSEQLIAHGRVKRGFLGIRTIDFGPQLVEAVRQDFGIKSLDELMESLGLPEPRGVYIYKVDPNSPAQKAGVKDNDVLLEFNGKPIQHQSSMLFAVAEATPGSTVTLKVLQEKKERELKAVLGERPPEDLRRRRR